MNFFKNRHKKLNNRLRTYLVARHYYMTVLDSEYLYRLPVLGFCYLLDMRNSPEILKHKPKIIYDSFWFPRNREGIQKRIDILNEAIQELENKF